jgi:hypothetical protein
MTDVRNDALARVASLEARVEALEAVQELLLRLLSTTRPLAGVLEYYSATETQEQAFYRLLDTMAGRTGGAERDRPSFAFFEMNLNEIFPHLRGDREFVQLLIDTLSVERPAYRTLHQYMVAHHWPTWSA